MREEKHCHICRRQGGVLRTLCGWDDWMYGQSADYDGLQYAFDVINESGSKHGDAVSCCETCIDIAEKELKRMTIDILKKPGVKNATIILRSGRYFDYLDPQPETIYIDDIAWGLANTCRFNGQCLEYYSVAQHSVLVSENVPKEHAFDALMHDAAEAYIGDVVAPLKQLLPDFKLIEARVEAAIAQRFGLNLPLHADIKHTDLRLLRTEQRDVTSGHAHNWHGLDQYAPLEKNIIPVSPDEAAALFLLRYQQVKR